MRGLIALVIFVSLPVAQAWPSSSSRRVVQEHVYPVSKRSYEKLQRYVNEGHQPWRTDGPAVASEELLMLEKRADRENVYTLPLKAIEETQREAIYEYQSAVKPGISYKIVLKRFRWLLPLAGSWRAMVWAPTEITVTRASKGSLSK